MDTPKQPPTILAVDNFPDWHFITRDVLKRLNVKLVLAGSVGEAKHLLENIHIDIVISGVRMPDGSGSDIFRLAESLNLPFILCTNFPHEMIREPNYEKFAYVWKGEIKTLPVAISRLLGVAL